MSNYSNSVGPLEFEPAELEVFDTDYTDSPVARNTGLHGFEQRKREMRKIWNPMLNKKATPGHLTDHKSQALKCPGSRIARAFDFYILINKRIARLGIRNDSLHAVGITGSGIDRIGK